MPPLRRAPVLAAGLALIALSACVDEPGRAPFVRTTEPDQPLVNLTHLDGASDEDVLASIFGDDVQRFALELSPTAWGGLIEQPTVKQRGTFVWNGVAFRDVGVRLKGNGSFQPLNAKPSLKIEFDTYTEGQDFFGLDVLVLNNMISDHSKAKERISYRLFREAGVPAARAGHSLLDVNGVPYGLYTHMEDVDDRMLARWFDNPDGPLHELFDATLNPVDVLDPERLQHEDGPDDRSALIGAADALALDTREQQMTAVANHVDLDAFRRYYAVAGYLGHFDAWPLNNPSDDVHLYTEPTSQRIHPIPHGLDESFAQYFRNVAIPGDSLLGQACYFTDDCREALAAEFWAVHQIALDIDLAGYALEVGEQVHDLAVDDVRDDSEAVDIDLWQPILVDYLLSRAERLEENMGPPP